MTHRIALWGTGGVGRAAGRAVHQHPEMEIAGCFAHGPDKVGRDVGEIIGIGPIGVIAVGTVAEIVALEPDLVLYTPLKWDVDAMVELLSAGIDVISTANFITGLSYGKEEKERLIQAAIAGDASLFGTGINPGFANALGLASSASCSVVRKIMVSEGVDATHYASPDTWTSLGYGGPRDAPGLVEKVRERTWVFIDAVEMMASALKIELDGIEFDADFAAATEDLDLGYMQIARGMICGSLMMYRGVRNGRTVIELRLLWHVGNSMDKDWVADGYVVEITGNPDIRCQYTLKEHEPTGHALPTAMHAVHAIPAVIAARPGLVLASDLTMIVAAHSVAD